MTPQPVLLGPADPDHFRTKVGRFKDRWYVDPLAADDIASATDKAWPAVSTIKGVSTPSWNQSQHVAIKRIAAAYRAAPDTLTKLDERDTIATLSMWNEGDLSRAGDRGTAVHHYIEYVRLRGMPSMIDLTAAAPYIAAVDAWFDAYQPQLVAAEIVVIHRHLNGVGYGGTIDAIVMVIDGKRYLVDWKTRGENSDHAAYTAEAAQVGAYAGAEYCIMDVDGHARRVDMASLNIDAGLLVSIRPDGCRAYPVDLGLAFEYFASMHAWWNASRTDAQSIGRPWAPVPVTQRHLTLVQPPAPVPTALGTDTAGHAAPATHLPAGARRGRLIDRIGELINAGHGPALTLAWPMGVPGLTATNHTDADLVAILGAVQRVSDDAGLAWHADEGVPSATEAAEIAGSVTRHPSSREGATTPVEGADVDVGDLHALHARFVNLSDEQRTWIRAVSAHADQAGRSISLNARPSVRRYEIGRAIILLTEATWHTGTDGVGRVDDVFIRAALAAVTDTADIATDRVPIGALLAELSPPEASWLADIAMAVGSDLLTITPTAEGYVLTGPVMSR